MLGAGASRRAVRPVEPAPLPALGATAATCNIRPHRTCRYESAVQQLEVERYFTSTNVVGRAYWIGVNRTQAPNLYAYSDGTILPQVGCTAGETQAGHVVLLLAPLLRAGWRGRCSSLAGGPPRRAKCRS